MTPTGRGIGPQGVGRTAEGMRDSKRVRAAESPLEQRQFVLCRSRIPVTTLPGMSQHRQWPGPKRQSYAAATELPSYGQPPASGITLVRRDGTQETQPALAGEPHW